MDLNRTLLFTEYHQYINFLFKEPDKIFNLYKRKLKYFLFSNPMFAINTKF